MFKIKHKDDGSITSRKARLTTQGRKQDLGLNYFDTFNPIAKFSSIRTLLTLIIKLIYRLDVSNSFIHGTVDTTIYMQQSHGFVDKQFSKQVCLLKKALYGLKQAPRRWLFTFSTHIINLWFMLSKVDSSLFNYNKNYIQIYAIRYVDDMLITGSNESSVLLVIQ